MNTLRSAPLAPLLERLFEEAAAASRPATAGLSDEEFARLARSRTEYRAFYGRLKDAWLPVSRETGALLYMLVRSSHAHAIVEFGMSFGISTLHLAAGLRDNGGGRVITSEFEPSKIARAREHFRVARLADLIEIREGDALQTLGSALPESIDFVLLDGAKPLYPDVLRLVEQRLPRGALLVADNAGMSPEYLARVRPPDQGYVSAPCGEDVELSLRTG